MGTATFDWGGLHYEEAGTGFPVMLISGLNGLAHPWQGVVSHLSQQFRIITHDHRGLGASHAWDGPYSVDQIAADVLGLMDRLGVAKAHLVGHSLGGAVAQSIAADHPDRVAGLVLYATWPCEDPYFARVMTMRPDMLTTMGVEAFLLTGPLGIYPPRWINENDAMLKAALPSLVANFVGTDTMLRRMDACLAHERRATLSAITAPTLVLGLQDDFSTPPHCSQELAASIANATLTLLPYGGHNAHLVVPDQVQAVLTNFLNASEVAASARD